MALRKEIVYDCLYRLMIIVDIVLDGIVLAIFLIIFYLLGELATILGLENTIITNIMDFYIHPIILLTLGTSMITNFVQKLFLTSNNSRYEFIVTDDDNGKQDDNYENEE